MRVEVFKENIVQLQDLNTNLSDYIVGYLCRVDTPVEWHCQRQLLTAATLWLQVGVNEFMDLKTEERNNMNGVRGLNDGPKCPTSEASSTGRVVAMALANDVSTGACCRVHWQVAPPGMTLLTSRQSQCSIRRRSVRRFRLPLTGRRTCRR